MTSTRKLLIAAPSSSRRCATTLASVRLLWPENTWRSRRSTVGSAYARASVESSRVARDSPRRSSRSYLAREDDHRADESDQSDHQRESVEQTLACHERFRVFDIPDRRSVWSVWRSSLRM